MILTIITFILVLSLLVFAHELGHFLTARRFGLTPEEFGFGFPPRAWGVYKNKEGKWRTVKGKKKATDAGDTIYSINWLPLGGFVKLGEDDVDVSPEANHFHNKPIWQRAVMLLAGVTMNMILAMVLIGFGFMIGLPQVIDENLPAGAIVRNQQVQVVEVLDGSPAAQAGLKIGDVMVSGNGAAFMSAEALADFTGRNENMEVSYLIKRGRVEMNFNITPIYLAESDTVGVGVGIADTGLVRFSLLRSIWEGVKTTFYLTVAILVAFGKLFQGIFTGQGVGAEIAGPVGIAVITGQVTRMGFVYILQFAALLSINLAIINAAPFPALDGGRMLFLILEKLKGRPVKRELEGTIHYIGFALLMLLILVVTFKDVTRIGDNIKFFWDKVF